MTTVALGQHTLITGDFITTLADSIGLDSLAVCEAYGVDQIRPDEWYTECTLIDLLQLYFGTTDDMVQIGTKYGQSVPMPGNVRSVIGAMHAMVRYCNQSRSNTRRPGYEFRMTSGHNICVNTTTTYPTAFVYGVLYGIAGRYTPPGTQIEIDYVVSQNARAYTTTVFHVKWDD